MFAEAYIQTASTIFESYKPQLPLAVYLKNFFKAHKKFGSRDRKYIADLLYGIYRLGNKNTNLSIRERMILGSFLSGEVPLIFFEKIIPELAVHYNLSFAEKKKYAEQNYNWDFHIPYQLTEGVSQEQYIEYLFRPAKVFLKIRGNKEQILADLNKNSISYEEINENCVALPRNTKIHDVLANDKDYIIQDYSSQLAGNFFTPKENENWWDCCAASGGKSLLLLDKGIKINLTVSDIRESILKELTGRLHKYGYTNFETRTLDISTTLKEKKLYDNIIADVPCSGSGTWSRSPEQFYFFTEEKLESFHILQKKILNNLADKMTKKLYYFTCSVFAKENENVTEACNENIKISLKKVLNGFEIGADSLFMCIMEPK